MLILQNSEEIKKFIYKILNNNSDRIIIVAYVGDNAISYLPNPKNIELYCSTNIPGTNPSSLRKLKQNGVKIFEVKKLHSKIYWSNSSGVVIGSANLSNNGLSVNGNHELGVFLPKNNFDARSYLEALNSTEISYSFIDILEKKYNLYMLKNKQNNNKRKIIINNFKQWHKKTGPQWKIYMWTEFGELPKDVNSELKQTFPGAKYYNFMQTDTKNAFNIGGWVLNAKAVWKGDSLLTINKFSWFIPEIMIKSTQKNSADYPYYWIQMNNKLPQNVPFNIRSKSFEKAFTKSYLQFTNQEKRILLKNNYPSKKFIESTRNYLNQ